MSSWAGRLQAAVERWREGDLDGAAGALREIVISAETGDADGDGGAEVAVEASHLLGRLLQERGDLDGARAAHRAVAAGGHPVFAQRSAVALGLMLVDEEEWALAHRPLRAAASGADTEIAAMAELTLITVLRRLGDLDGAEAAVERARRGADPDIARMAGELSGAGRPADGGERERQAWEAYESITALLDGHPDEAEAADEVVLTALDRMLAHGMPELCTRAAFRLYSIHARRGEFAACRRVMEHAIAVGDPAERGPAEKLLGAALFDLGENAEAREAYRRAAADHRPEIRLDALIQESKFTREMDGAEGEREARAILWRVVESGHPEFALEARACLGQVYSEAGEVADAVDCWRAVLEGGSEFRKGAVHFLGMLLTGLPPDDPRRAEIGELLERAGEIDDDPDLAFQAGMILAHADAAVRGPDEVYEQAVDDCDAALERLREGEVDRARALLRQVIDAGIAGQSERAATMLAALEFGEGDAEQADELLEDVAAGEEFARGFAAAVNRLMIAASGAGAPHPVLAALVDYQRLGREIGIARYQECAGGADPSVAALAKGMLGQVYVSLGVPRSQGVELLEEAAAAGDPLALSHAAVLSWIVRDAGDPAEAGAVIGLLRRARDEGHPALAPWVAWALGAALQRRDGDGDAGDALAAYEDVSRSGHPGLIVEAEANALQILEARGDLAGAAAAHERIVARGDRLRAPRSAWLLGFTRVRLDDFDAARAAFAKVPEDHPELAADGVFARHLLDRDFEAAAAALDGVRDRGEDHLDAMTAWLTLEAAHAWQRAGEHAAADAALSLAAEHAPAAQAQEAALYLGALRNDVGDHTGAAEAWARAADGEDEYRAGKAAGGLGEVLFHLGDLDGSATAYRRALDATDPGDDEHPGLLDSAVRVLVAAGRVDEARAVQVERTGDGPHVALVIGTALRDGGDPDAAAAEFQAAVDTPAGDDRAVWAVAMAGVMLARLCAGWGEPAQAAEHAARAVADFERLAAPDQDAAQNLAAAAFELGGYLAETGDAEGAREAYERAAASSDPDIALPAMERLGTADLMERAVLRLGEGDEIEALELLTRHYDSGVLAELHVALFHWRLPAVRELFRRSAGTEHAGAVTDMVSSAAQERLAMGADGADELCGLVLAHGTPRQVAEICAAFGHAQDQAGDLDAAIETLERGAAVDDPAGLLCLRYLLPVLSRRDDHDALMAAARRAVATADPETATQGHWMLGGALWTRGDLEGAVTELRAAAAVTDAAFRPHIELQLGGALHEYGDVEGAHRILEPLLACEEPYVALHAGSRLGAWLGRDGRHAGAAEALGAAAAAALRVPEPDEEVRELHQIALNNLATVAGMADEAGEPAVAVRALRLAAAGGAPGDAVEIAKGYGTAAAERDDLDAARVYYKGAADFPPDGDPGALLELAALLAQRGANDEARRLLEPLAPSDDAALPAPAIEPKLAPDPEPVPAPDASEREDERRRDDLFAFLGEHEREREKEFGAGLDDGHGPDGLDSLLWLMRNQSGTATAGAAGRQLIRAARQVVDDDPGQAREILAMVVEHGDPEEVATAYDDIGDIHGYVEDDMAAAVAAYRKGAEVDHPAALLPLRSLLLALSNLEDYDAVAETAQRAVTTGDPETVAVGYWLWGESRGHRGDSDAAVRLYRRGVEAGHPDVTPRIRADLARTLRDRGEAEEAMAEIAHAAAAPDRDVRARAGCLHGQWAFDDGDLETAAEALGAVALMEIDPADPEPVASLADQSARNLLVVAERAHREGRYETATRALTLLGRTGRHVAGELAGRRATELAEAGDRAAAMLYVECIAGMLSDPSADMEIGLADLYVSAGDPERAREIYERLAGHDDAEVRLVANGRLVPLLRHTGDAAGLETVTRAMTGDSAATGLDEGDRAFLGSLLGLLQQEQGDDEGAMRTFRAAAESGASSALFSLGQALVDAGEFEEAREVLGRIPDTATRYTRHIAVLLARSHHEERPDQARELYLRAVQGEGDADARAEALAKMYLGALAKRDRDWPEALRWYRQVIDAGVEGQAPLAAAHLGELAYWLGDRDSAVRYYELTLATGTTKAELVGEAAYRLGEIRHGDGDLDQAARHLRQAVDSGDEGFADQARALLAKIDQDT
ncbi:hypothetical protein GCM10010191_37630 [Actinomadura vinacea]|uniref:Tetratricopeptide repeat protein n=1 Tax=Actinomadura vinacea TaxID=115336 RepID=A0ABP5W8U6_9ACTN